MIGIFALDDKEYPAFVQYGEHERIASLRFTPECYCIVQLDDGTEQMFTTEVHPEVMQAIRPLKQLPIIHMTDDGVPVSQYDAPISF